MSQEHNVTSDDDGIRLDRWFKRHYPALPHAMLQKQLRKGSIRVDGVKADTSDRVRFGQVIQVKFDLERLLDSKPARPKPVLSEQDVAMMQNLVLYQDERMIVLNKPEGIATQGGSKITRSIDGLLDALAGDGGRPKLTHRLDRDTSGCLVLARDAKVATKLMNAFSRRDIHKTYLALINGAPSKLEGMIELSLSKKANPKESGRGWTEYEVMVVDPEGQKALTEYRVLDSLAGKFSLIELKPHTGRTHQLRVHMQAVGCPIVGDHKYGGITDDLFSLGIKDQLHLHAWRIEIPAFGGAQSVTVTAPLSEHMQQSLEALGIEAPKEGKKKK